MAFICTKLKGSCRNCEHYRYDEDYGGKVCFAKQDAKETHKRTFGHDGGSCECVLRED